MFTIIRRMRRIFLLYFLAMVLAGVAKPLSAQDISAEDDNRRRDYLAAMEALKSGHPTRFKKLYERLDGYILRGYLEYEYLKHRIASSPPADIRRFLEEKKSHRCATIFLQR